LLADILDRRQATVVWFQAGEELLDTRRNGTSTQLCWDRGGLPRELAGVVEVSSTKLVVGGKDIATPVVRTGQGKPVRL
jgi:hypothetical protein